ncbi:PAS domain S-box-containing protein [Thalassovita litoralis]|jgi:PAS domain S-box-containing protein|uniref:PAS domain S-box-containing protein n=1 Tax=Thalassovita litoralis TaxID=1010611 RepID=A0A521BG43_9RHOB|nr:LuxR C-terminal-related transcriptional regulator [Thalassovita litoralis]SMO46077.1 PAS domain S-box-containing protein [Thalassovita litoralis]
MTDLVDQAYASGDFMELMFSHAPVGLVVTQNRVIRDCNPTFATMFGYDRAELRDRLFNILYPSEAEFANIRNRGIKDLQENTGYWDERVMMRKTGENFWVRVRGHTFTPQEPLQRAVWSFADLSRSRPYQPLTRREREVFSLMGEGKTSKEIAQILGMSYRTVEVHRGRLLKKFRASNTAGLFQSLGQISGPHVVKSDEDAATGTRP